MVHEISNVNLVIVIASVSVPETKDVTPWEHIKAEMPVHRKRRQMGAPINAYGSQGFSVEDDMPIPTIRSVLLISRLRNQVLI